MQGRRVFAVLSLSSLISLWSLALPAQEPDTGPSEKKPVVEEKTSRTRHVITLDQAFHNMFWIGVAMAAVSVILAISMMAFSRRYKVISAPSATDA